MARLAFLGSPASAAVSLRALVGAGHDVAVVVTRDDKRRARGAKSSPTPVKRAAEALGLEVTTELDRVTGVGAELGVVVAYGRIIPSEVLCELPMVNVHYSLLPRWRGAAPVERALLAGDAETGVCLMEVVEELDAGGVYARRETPILPGESAEELTSRLALLGAALLVDRLTDGLAGLGEAAPQLGEVTYARKLSPAERRLDFERQADELLRLVRLGRAWTTWRGRRLLVWTARAETDETAPEPPGTVLGDRVATGAGFLVPEVVQPEGRSRQSFSAFLRGARLEPGERLGASGEGPKGLP